MSERKAINKYYPPDWDPSKVTKKIKPKNQIIKVRLEAPYSMRCLKCSEYISALRKFNAKKEITKEVYMNVKIIRFYISCPRCNNQITFKTNPQNADFVPENGAVRNYESQKKVADAPKDRLETEEEILLRLEKEDIDNNSYQTLKERRKKDPFWQKKKSLKDQEGNIIDHLAEKLAEQQRQQELSKELEDIHKKNRLFQKQGGTETALQAAQDKLLRQDTDQENARIEEEESLKAKLAFRKNRSQEIDTVHHNDSGMIHDNSTPGSIQRQFDNGLTAPKSTFVLRKRQTNETPTTQNDKKTTLVNQKAATQSSGLSSMLGDYESDDE